MKLYLKKSLSGNLKFIKLEIAFRFPNGVTDQLTVTTLSYTIFERSVDGARKLVTGLKELQVLFLKHYHNGFPYTRSMTNNSNIYRTRCNVTQFTLSGNCSTYFG